MSAFDPKRTSSSRSMTCARPHIRAFECARFRPVRRPVLSLGGGNETARVHHTSGRRRGNWWRAHSPSACVASARNFYRVERWHCCNKTCHGSVCCRFREVTMKIVSRDGTLIACEQGGRGPHLVLVHGTSANSLRWEEVRPRLEEHFTVTRIDRRGRGGSGDSAEYAIEREFEDVATVVNALEAPVLLFGHSFGAVCALEAAMRTEKLAGLMLYEAPVCEGESLASPDLLERLESLLATGDREGVLSTLLC